MVLPYLVGWQKAQHSPPSPGPFKICDEVGAAVLNSSKQSLSVTRCFTILLAFPVMSCKPCLNSLVLKLLFICSIFLPTHLRAPSIPQPVQWQRCQGMCWVEQLWAFPGLMWWKKLNSVDAAPALLSGPLVGTQCHVGKFNPEEADFLVEFVHSSLTAVESLN